ncbi:MAG: cytochrome B [Rhodovulum sulfidophilum]|uniref:Cytochrome B n=1 Tax=Rhodovulum sulfidophilum TaxID=35806 RepID=A0A2W5NJC2_RHOSU|nr:MAG: cytochrome B [Rhodovulum sulfidophilum]
MRARNSGASWGWVARALHWSMAGLILFQIGLGVAMVYGVADPLRQFALYQTHKSWGFVLFALALIRIAWWWIGGPRPGLGALPRWRRRLAEGVQALFYALMLWMPVSGWISASAAPVQDVLGIPNMVFGWFALPDPWVPGDARIAGLAGTAHLLGAVLLGLALGAHVAGALGHARDGILARMTFGK